MTTQSPHRPLQSCDVTGVALELVDYNRLYESVSDRAMLINDFDITDEDEKQRLDNLLYIEYEGDTLDTMPSCDCGQLKGEYNAGLRCGNCGTIVSTVTDQPMESILWMRVPDGVHAFMSPQVWNILNNTFKAGGVQLIRWLCDSSYVPPNAADKKPNWKWLFDDFREMNWKRSINHFYENFDMIMDYLLTHSKIVTPAWWRRQVGEFVTENKHLFFTQYLPIPNRSVFITERTAVGTYADEVMHSAIDAVRTISSLRSSIVETTQRVKENRTVKATQQLADYYARYIKENLSGKPGMFRRQVYGSRLDFSARAVISSLSHPHHYDEVHFPWGMAVMMLKTHITSKLLRRGLSPSECEGFLMVHTNTYHSMLDEIFQELINECPYIGLPIIFQRNPSLVRGSAQLLYITQVKPDPTINTISFSVLALAAPNADFDGDQMNVELLLDRKEHDEFYRLAPHLGVMDTHSPFQVSGNVKLPGPVIGTMVNWMHECE